MRNYACLLLLLIPSCFYSQGIEPPSFSFAPGFYLEDIELQIEHPQPNLILLYSLDGSEPLMENIAGKSWNYKKYYPILPGDSFGPMFTETSYTYSYNQSLILTDRTPATSVLADVYTTIEKHNVRAFGELFKGHIVRARAYDAVTGEYSPVISGNFFITENGSNRYTIPVLAISFDNEKFYDYEHGIGVPGILFDAWRAANPTQSITGWEPANYRLSGDSTEFRIHFNYFVNGEDVLNHDAGMRINGGYTRANPNKSLRLYAKNDYGEKNFNYPFFEGYPVTKFKRLVLRNSGNDAVGVFFRDAFMHKLAKGLNFDVQESQPVALFLNGEYNGLRNIRERYDKKYFESIHNIPEDQLDFLENHVEVKEGDAIFYNQMMALFENNNISFSDDAVYNNAISFLDPVNFSDYYATTIYSGNNDWPMNNYLFFRHRTTYDPTAPASVNDGRFRWILKDLDRAFFLKAKPENGHEWNTLEWATQQDPSTIVIRRLLENEHYKNYFITRFADLLNTTFKPDRVLGMIDDFKDIYAPEIEENGRRWYTYTVPPGPWLADVNRMKNFGTHRPHFQRQHIIDKFNLPGTFEMVLNVSDENHGYIHLNTIDIKEGTHGIDEIVYPWVGEYFKNIPVTLTAIPKDGYRFSHWSGYVNTSANDITLNLAGDTYIKANFVPEHVGTDDDFYATAIKLFPNPTRDMIYIQSATDWESFEVYDLQGRLVKIGEISKSSIALSELALGSYFINLKTTDKKSRLFRIIKE